MQHNKKATVQMYYNYIADKSPCATTARVHAALLQQRIAALLLLSAVVTIWIQAAVVVAAGEAAACQGLEGSCASAACCDGFSCHPGILKCYHSPRYTREPCAPGHGCSDGLHCIPAGDSSGVFTCRPLAGLNDTCATPHVPGQPPCMAGLSCHPGVWRCYNVPRLLGQPCSADADCSAGLRCGQRTHVCKPADTPRDNARGLMQSCTADDACAGNHLRCDPDLKRCIPRSEAEFRNATEKGTELGYDVCLAFRERHLANLSTDLNLAFTFGVSPSATVGMATGSFELGVAYGPGGQYGCYVTICAGAAMGLGVSVAGAIGNYFEWDSIPGMALLLGGGYGDIKKPKAWKLPGFVQLGVSATGVANTDMQLTGYVVSLSISVDVLTYLDFPLFPPVFGGFTVCNTTVLEVPRVKINPGDYPPNAVFVDYTIIACTGASQGAGTDGDVYVWLSGDQYTTVRPFSLFSVQYLGENHERGRCYKYKFNDIDVGTLKKATVRLARKMAWDNWQLASLQVTKGQEAPVKYCLNDWLDGSSDVVLTDENACTESNIGKTVNYTLRVCTGDATYAGTDGEVHVKLCGTLDCTDVHELDTSGVNDHERGECGDYTISDREIGILDEVKLYLENVFFFDNWLLSSVQVDRVGQETHRLCYQDWLPDLRQLYSFITLTVKDDSVKCLVDKRAVYYIRACTGDGDGAGTDSTISVVVCGSLGCTPHLTFDQSSIQGNVINLNERGDCYNYKFELDINVGTLETVAVSKAYLPRDMWQLKNLTAEMYVDNAYHSIDFCFDGWIDNEETVLLTSASTKECSPETNRLQLDLHRARWFRILPRVQPAAAAGAEARCLAGHYYMSRTSYFNYFTESKCYETSAKVNGTDFQVFGFVDTGISSLKCGLGLPPCPEGHCCSSAGKCGTLEEHCGLGCRPRHGACFDSKYYAGKSTRPPGPSPAAGANNGSHTRCGSGQRCRLGCCSPRLGNSCGIGQDWCGDGCDPKYGVCSGVVLPGEIDGEYTNYFAIMNVEGLCLDGSDQSTSWQKSCNTSANLWQVVVREIDQDGTKWIQLVDRVTSSCLGVQSQPRDVVFMDCQAADRDSHFRLDWFGPTSLKRAVVAAADRVFAANDDVEHTAVDANRGDGEMAAGDSRHDAASTSAASSGSSGHHEEL